MPSRRGHVDHSHLNRKLHVKKLPEAREPGLIPPSSPTPPSGGGGGDNGGGGNSNGGGGGNWEDGGGDGNGGGDGGDGAGDGGGRGDGNGGGGGAGNGNVGNSNGGNSNNGGVGASNPGEGGATNNRTNTPVQTPSPVGETGTTELKNGATSTSVSPFGLENVGTHLTHTVSSATSSGYIAVTTGSSSTGLSSLSPSQSGIVNKNDSGSHTGPTSSGTGTLNQNHRLSSGGIAGIVIFLLVVGLAGLVLVLRKRAIACRIARRRWFMSTGLYADFDSPGNSATTTSWKLGSPPGSRSARSSFGTTFDQSRSLKFGFDFDPFLPPIPPMAEIRGEGPLIVGAAPSHSAPKNQRKFTGSNNSSDPNAQYVLLPPGIQGDEVIGMPVRPFSPFESYLFPRPPPSREGKSLFYKDGNSHGEGADKDWSLIDASQKSPATASPFADPVPAATAMQPDFTDIEMIQRPFMPTLPDELVVAVGDRVRILRTFDDGWAFVQKLRLPLGNDKKGKAKTVNEFDQGLIPIDCLRNANQDLPAFLVQKRVSSYVEDGGVVFGIAC